MKRIFLSLAAVSMLLLVAAFVLGWMIGDPAVRSAPTRSLLKYHLLTSVAALIFAALVHAVLLTYFMGTSRWMEETRQAYKLDDRWDVETKRLKYRTIPWMAACVILLIVNIPLGAMSADGSDWTIGAVALSPGRVHLVFAAMTCLLNAWVLGLEFRAVAQNAEHIAGVVDAVTQIRRERGLPV